MKRLLLTLLLAAPLAGCVVVPAHPYRAAGCYWVPGHFGPYGGWHPGHCA